MRRYLKEFLSDKRVVEAKGPLWWLVLNAIILVRRPKKSGRAYAKIWNKQQNESPLRTITREQTKKISEYYKKQSPDQIRLGDALWRAFDRRRHRRTLETGMSAPFGFPALPAI